VDEARNGCGGETLHQKIEKKLDGAVTRAELAPTQTPKAAKRTYRRIRRLLLQAKKAATRARSRPSDACAAELTAAIDLALSLLPR
jgi:hypothetical protein